VESTVRRATKDNVPSGSRSDNDGSRPGPGWIWVCLVALSWMAAVPVRAQDEVTRLVDGIEARLERMPDFSADFVQISEEPLNQPMEESGHLYLKAPRRMRWDYQDGKQFLSDGDTLYLYVPADGQVQFEEVGDSFDERVPIGFLLGRPDLHQEFSRIVLDASSEPRVSGTRILRMVPAREGEFEEVMIEVDPRTFDIRRLRLSRFDGGASDFLFTDIRTGTGLENSWFEFDIPDGVEVIEGL
jgi:outer membrane lipoprotein carrier protein